MTSFLLFFFGGEQRETFIIMILNLPNILTIFRLFLIPVFILTFFSNLQHNLLFSTLIFMIAGITDVTDGYIARRYNLVTKLGVVLDPLADKLMLLTVLSCLVVENYIPLWILLIVAAKDIFMIIAGIFLYKKDTFIPSNYFGKISTILFYISIFIFCFNRQYGSILLYISVASAVIALTNYSIIYHKNRKA